MAITGATLVVIRPEKALKRFLLRMKFCSQSLREAVKWMNVIILVKREKLKSIYAHNNVRTLRNEENMESLLEELDGFKWDVVGLAETKIHGEGLTELKGGAWLYNRGKDRRGQQCKRNWIPYSYQISGLCQRSEICL